MIRKVIRIDEALCNGCGICAQACHEGAIGMVDSTARLLREDYCDGLGDCLPTCPTGAITFEEREAPAYNEAAVKAAQRAKTAAGRGTGASTDVTADGREDTSGRESQLRQWPVQIKLAPLTAPYFDGADLLVAADCSAYAHGDFHNRFIRGHVVLIGCPKLDAVDYAQKLTEIFRRNAVRSVTVARMEVPCCGGIEMAVRRAIEESGASMDCSVVTIGTDGTIL